MSSIEADSPLAKQLQNVVQHKLMELGWSTGGLDDSVLAEYIVLMVANGRTPPEVSKELASDFLGDSTGAPEFAEWLFQEVNALVAPSDAHSQSTAPAVASDGVGDAMKTEDADMDVDSTESAVIDGSIPTGPKSMRSRDKRFLGQMNKALDRSGDNRILHRIKGTAGGVGRVNTHSGPPRGPAGMKGAGVPPKGPRATMNRLANAPVPPQSAFNPTSNLQFNNPNSPFGNMTPEQQMQLMSMYEQQAKMMAQIFNPQQNQSTSIQGNGFQGQRQSKSLLERVHKGPYRPGSMREALKNGPQIDDAGSSMEVDGASQGGANQDQNSTMCKFNLHCKNPECYFVHQSPAAPQGVTVDMTDTCAFGSGCKNRKCTGKHPSPAKLGQQDCKFFPNCTNVACTFKHPNMPPCRNGADCTTSGCKFSHTKVECKYDPCLNALCPFKHREGQQRGAYNDKVWVANGGEKEHVSDRKFVDDINGEEDLVVPEAKPEEVQPEGIVT